MLFGDIAYTAPRGWYVAGDAIYTGEQFADNANSAAGHVDAYTLVSLRFGYDVELGSFTVSPFAGVHNLTDETYTANVRLNAFGSRFFEPGPGRNGYAGVTLDWKFR